MSIIRTTDNRRALTAARVAGLCAGALLLTSAMAPAQDSGRADPPAQAEQPNLFERVGRWFDEQATNIDATFRGAGKEVVNFGREAGVAAKSTVDGAKDAADAVALIPKTRVVKGHEKCRNAPNGAPDCVAAAYAICKTQGFGTGKSLDMTTSEICPPKVYLSGRNSGPECRSETFVSSVLCQ